MVGPARHPFADRWNHNSHHYPLLADRIPDHARRVLDVGCGDGTFCRFVAREGRLVVGIDTDVKVLPDGSAPLPGEPVFARADMQRLCFADDTFDAVTAVMVMHHGDTVAAVRAAARVLAPGGVLLILGYGDRDGWGDVRYEVRDVITHHVLVRRTTAWHPRTVVADAARTWRAERRLLQELLPGSSFRRLPLWRYLAEWHKPR